MVYGSETWALKKAHMEILSAAQLMELLSAAQLNMERIMLGITLRVHKRNTWIRHQTCENDIINVIKRGKRKWANTLHDSKTTDGQKSDRVDTTRMDREDLKQDGETALSATWVRRGQ